jgi:NAD binding domain of 6-phosphogluconate dehydrogenase
MREIGFVGLGAMGLPMALRLVARDFAVRGFDLRRPAMDALAEAGGHAAVSAKEAARGAQGADPDGRQRRAGALGAVRGRGARSARAECGGDSDGDGKPRRSPPR